MPDVETEQRRAVPIRDWATATGTSYENALRLARAGRLGVPTFRVGRRIYVPRDAMERVLADGMAAEAPGGR